MENNRPHSREKRVSEGFVTASKGQKINTGGPVGGSSQNDRPGPMPGGPQRYGGQTPFGGAPRRTRVRRAGGGIGLSGSRTSSETTDAEGQDKQNENRPTGRTAGEIKVQTNLDGVAYHITGRAPPADA